MKTLLAFVAAVMVVVPSAMASSTTCPTTTYDQYLVSNFTCVSGNVMFSSFGYSGTGSPSGMVIPASGIAVTPQTMTLNEGFQFSSGWLVGTQPNGSSSFQDSLISFTVSTVNGATTLDDLTLFFNGNFTGTGLSGVAEQYCLGGTLQNCAQGHSGQIKVTNPPPGFNSAVFFQPTTTISVSKDINVTSGSAGTASISQVINTFSQISQVPEPLSCLLMGSGLLGLGLCRKRAQRW